MGASDGGRAKAEVELDVVERRNLSGQAYDALRRLVVSGTLQPGEHLAVRPLTERLRMSPTPIRLAMAQLARDGLLDLEDHRGYFVPHLEAGEMFELYEVRAAVDSVVSRRVASLPDRTRLVARLRELVEQQREAVADDDLYTYGELDVQFHGEIWQRGNNRRLAVIASNLLSQVRAGNRISARAPGRLATALEEHVEIVDALEAGDTARAEVATRHHVEQASLALQSLLEGDAGLPSGS